MSFSGLRVALIGPLPPPAGGMANQMLQLGALLGAGAAEVVLVPVNPPFPALVESLRGVRALCRLLPYLLKLWRVAGRVDLFHVMANSGWSWHLFAAPAIWIGWVRRVPVVVNYRGGEAARFMARSGRLVSFSLRRAQALVVPSAYLARVFGSCGLAPRVVPNIVDLARFPFHRKAAPASPVLLVARNLESIYDNATALRAFALVRTRWPTASLLIAGCGPERAALEALAGELGLARSVTFTGRVDHAAMAALYWRADIAINPSLADNMPNSILEALASGVPVVSTNVGGIPDLLGHGESAMLVPPGQPQALAAAILTLLASQEKAQALRDNGRALAERFTWPRVAPLLLAQYRRVLARPRRSLRARLARALLFPLHEGLKRHRSVALRRQLERSQWWPAERVRALQLERLRTLLSHAGTHVPWYRALFQRLAVDRACPDPLTLLQSLPILRKDDIRRSPEAFRSDVAGKLARSNTGGSSGEPLVFYVGKRRIEHDVAAKWRATRWWDVDIGEREIVVWGSPIELKAQDRLRHLRDRLMGSTLLPAFDMRAAHLEKFIAVIRHLRPAMLFGYPSALCMIARHARSCGIALDQAGVRVAFVTSERLYDDQRETISTAFGCPVANGYGGRDAGFIAHECPSGGMHISAEDIIVEILGKDGRPVPAGEAGEIVVTHLATGDFPFIRYATGDIGALGTAPCPCGRTLPLLTRIDGRSTDFVQAQDGAVMHGLALIYVLRDLPQIRAFRIIQESIDQTRVIVVALPALDGALRATIESGLKARLGVGVTIIIDEVSAIAPDASGKFRYVVSHIKPA